MSLLYSGSCSGSVAAAAVAATAAIAPRCRCRSAAGVSRAQASRRDQACVLSKWAAHSGRSTNQTRPWMAGVRLRRPGACCGRWRTRGHRPGSQIGGSQPGSTRCRNIAPMQLGSRPPGRSAGRTPVWIACWWRWSRQHRCPPPAPAAGAARARKHAALLPGARSRCGNAPAAAGLPAQRAAASKGSAAPAAAAAAVRMCRRPLSQLLHPVRIHCLRRRTSRPLACSSPQSAARGSRPPLPPARRHPAPGVGPARR